MVYGKSKVKAKAKTKAKALLPLTAWQTELLRLTAFPTSVAEVSGIDWWADLFGRAPESSTVRTTKGERLEEGPFEQGALRLSIQPFRIDWYFLKGEYHQEQQEDVKLEMAFPTIGPFPEAADKFLKLMLSWLAPSVCPPLHRLAFGAILLQPVESHEAGYRRISNYLPDIKIDPSSRDFHYQINRQRNSLSEIEGLKVNRLNKWSVLRGAMYQFGLGRVKSFQREVGPEHFECRLELDISSSAEFPELPAKTLGILFQEFVKLGKEIASKGDIS